jgi:hypothetical protein
MGERDEACPFAVLRGTGVNIMNIDLSAADLAIPWDMCIYVESLTSGALPSPQKADSPAPNTLHAPSIGD